MFAVDKKVHEEVSKGKSYKESDILNFGKYYGETLTSQVASLSVTATGIILCDKKITRLGLELFESYIITDRLVFSTIIWRRCPLELYYYTLRFDYTGKTTNWMPQAMMLWDLFRFTICLH